MTGERLPRKLSQSEISDMSDSSSMSDNPSLNYCNNAVPYDINDLIKEADGDVKQDENKPQMEETKGKIDEDKWIIVENWIK